MWSCQQGWFPQELAGSPGQAGPFPWDRQRPPELRAEFTALPRSSGKVTVPAGAAGMCLWQSSTPGEAVPSASRVFPAERGLGEEGGQRQISLVMDTSDAKLCMKAG